MKNLSEEEIEQICKDYIIEGGTIYSVRYIDTIRDGGTKLVKTQKMNVSFYVHMTDNTFHTSYPCTDNNKVTNKKKIVFLIDAINRHVEREDMRLRNNNLLLHELEEFIYEA